MILILTEAGDVTTYHVMRWLERYGKEVMLVTDKDSISGISINNRQTTVCISGTTVDFNKITAYWYRRGQLALPAYDGPDDLPPVVSNNIRKELQTVTELLHSRLHNIPHLGEHTHRNVNRLVVMDAATRVGLEVPAYGVFNRREQVLDFMATHGKIVTKPLSDGLMAEEDRIAYANYTALFAPEDAVSLPATFLPGLFAAYVPKKYELRIFYLDGDCYTMAVMSQQDSQTQTDMRHYNYRKPNRNVPYQLPAAIRTKVHTLMEALQLKTGSVDMIVTPEDKFVFLEVNPVGQFGNVSGSCHYNLEQKVAGYLLKLSFLKPNF